MSDRSLFRYPPGYTAQPLDPVLDWRAWGGFLGAAEMCNNNGACRASAGGVMCPSFRVTRAEEHVTRGRANVLRLALSGQLGAEALTSEAMARALELCVACKACRRECPTGVDMARMKIEVEAQRVRQHGLARRDQLIAYLPRWAPLAARLAPLLNLRARLPGLPALAERLAGFSRKRSLPHWHRQPWRGQSGAGGRLTAADDEAGSEPGGRLPAAVDRTGLASEPGGDPVVLFADTFTSWFEPENATAAERVLGHMGYRVIDPTPAGERPLCCGRTFLSAGLVEQAAAELRRTITALRPHLEAGAAVVGLEPACLLTFKDEAGALLSTGETTALAQAATLLPEFVLAHRERLRLEGLPEATALVHGHCHEKAFGLFDSVLQALALVPGLEVRAIESSCCGMAGAFGYDPRHYEISMRMGEAALLPAVRAAPQGTLLVADGTSCRHQIKDGTDREAQHLAQVLDRALA